MTDTEFLMRLPEGTEAPTDEEFELIQFVYNYHPCLDPAQGKKQIAMLYSTFGMRIILDICRSKLYNMMYGCGYIFNADFIAALDSLGYTLELKKKGGDSLDSGTQDPE